MPGASGGNLINTALTLFGGYSLKGGNLLLYFGAFTLWALEFFLFIFRNCYSEGKRLLAFFTDEFVYRHEKPPSLYEAP